MEVTGDDRQQRGLQLSRAKRLKQIVNGTWLVPSQSQSSGGYVVDVEKGTCTCPDHELRGEVVQCKHRWAVHFARFRQDSNRVLDHEIKRPTYAQNWPVYNAAQCQEKDFVVPLLRRLCNMIPYSPKRRRGRPSTNLGDVVFAACFRTYTGFSGRRAESDTRACVQNGLLKKRVSYNSIYDYLGDPDLTPILKDLVRRSAAPLCALETKFAIDSTGFGTPTYERWYNEKYGIEEKRAIWRKLHIACGVNTGVITAVEVTHGDSNDCPHFPQLVRETAETFRVDEVMADRAYVAVYNYNAVENVGGRPYIDFKSNNRLGNDPVWNRAFSLFDLNQEEWLIHYSQRSNVEAVFSSLKRLLGGSLRSRKNTAQDNEVLLKCICYNVTRLVHAMFEFGIDLEFRGAKK